MVKQKYSFLTSVYKKEHPDYFRLSLDSMVNQTVSPDEIVIVEDGPLTNGLYKIIDEYKTKYPDLIKLVINNENLGLGVSLNKGLEECRNEYVARMDTDDICKSIRCEKLLQKFKENQSLSIVGSYIDEFVGTTENIISQRRVPIEQDTIYNYAKRRSAFNHPAVMYKKSAVLTCGGYSSLRRNQDVDLFGRMLFAGYEAENIPESLLLFRSSNELSKRRKSWENTWSYISTIKRFWKMGYSSFFDFILVLCAQTLMYIMPTFLQNWIYKTFLRK